MANTNTNTNARNVRTNGRTMLGSEILDRKARRVGSDDLQTAANICKWGEQSGLRGPNLAVASSIAKAFEAAILLALRGEHREAAKKAASAQYVLKRNERVASLKAPCRDGRERKIGQIAEWYASVHFRVADDIDAALDAEREIAEQESLEAEDRLEAEQRRLSSEQRPARKLAKLKHKAA